MNKEYINLFRELSHAIEIISENMLEKHYKNDDKAGKKAAEIMRKDFEELYDFMRNKDFNSSQLTRSHFAKFLVGAIIFSKQLENKIENDKKILSNYKIDVIPKLDRLMSETTTDEECLKLANELFTISDS